MLQDWINIVINEVCVWHANTLVDAILKAKQIVVPTL
jgi:hypothetical protein